MRAPSSVLLLLSVITTRESLAFTGPASAACSSSRTNLKMSKDTPEILPDFENAEEYLEYMETFSGLPKGFATGTSEGKFVSVEAPSMGKLGIRGTVIHLTEGPSENWAACFTSNKVSYQRCIFRGLLLL